MTPDNLQAIRARHAAATDVSAAVRSRYDHGGGRMYIDGEARSLVLDAYEEADREFYFNAHADVAALLSALDATTSEPARCVWTKDGDEYIPSCTGKWIVDLDPVRSRFAFCPLKGCGKPIEVHP